MLLSFKKIPSSGINFKLNCEDVEFFGSVSKASKDLVRCLGNIRGKIVCPCDRCADDFVYEIDEKVDLFISDGMYNRNFLEVIEFFDGSIDFDTILKSEIELIKSDYHYCPKCADNK